MLQRNHFSWAKQIASFVNQGQGFKGLLIFHQLHKTGVKITEFLLSAVLKACGKLQALEEGRQAHSLVLKYGFKGDMVLMTSVLDLYSKCNCINDARMVFHEVSGRDIILENGMIAGFCRCGLSSEAIGLFNSMGQRDTASWNSLISGLGQNSNGRKALFFFKIMRLEGEKIDCTTVVSVLSACADLAALVNGKQIHGLVIRHGFEFYLQVGNAVIDMYAKSGCMEDAQQCFDNIPVRNVVSWTSLIVGYGKHGMGMLALKTFDQMELNGILPNKVTFVGTLSACSHAGLIQQGWNHFNMMIHTYAIRPMMEHYTCMVDLLGRAGHLEEACEFIKSMPVEPDAKLWTAFLSSCCFYMNIELIRTVGEKILALRPQPGAYMLLSNFYGMRRDWENVSKIRRLMLDRGVRKENACTWIEINGRVHAFESGDRSHALYKEIQNYLEQLFKRMRSNGYVPNTSMVVRNVDEQLKEEIVLMHSEKLAIGLGLICTPPWARIVIVKNLRVCIDCHVATKFISELEGREIVARDMSRFHQFKDGLCSCGDHW